MTRKMKKLILIGVPSAIVLIILIILGILFLTTDMFKSDGEIFLENLEKNSYNLKQIMSALENADYNEFIQQSKYSQNEELKINFTENYGTTSESKENIINRLKIVASGEKDKEDNYEYKDFKLLKDDEKKAEIEYLQKNNEYGLRFSDLFKQYLVIENESLKSLLKNMGYSEEDVEYFSDTFELRSFEDAKFSDEEIETLVKKYANIIGESISKEKIKKSKNQIININNTEIATDAYTLKLTKEELNNIYIKMLENLKEDEIILGKIDKLQECFYPEIFSMLDIELIKVNNTDVTKLKNEYVKNIEKEINDVKRNNIGGEECNITIYGKKGVVYRTEVKMPEKTLSFDYLETDKLFSDIVVLENDAEKKRITITKTGNETNIDMKDVIEEKPVSISYKSTQEREEEKFERNIDFKYEYNSNIVEISYSNDISSINEINDKKTFEDDNGIKLNYLDSEKIMLLMNKVKTDVNTKKAAIEQELNIQEVESILTKIGITKNKMVIENERSF